MQKHQQLNWNQHPPLYLSTILITLQLPLLLLQHLPSINNNKLLLHINNNNPIYWQIILCCQTLPIGVHLLLNNNKWLILVIRQNFFENDFRVRVDNWGKLLLKDEIPRLKIRFLIHKIWLVTGQGRCLSDTLCLTSLILRFRNLECISQ